MFVKDAASRPRFDKKRPSFLEFQRSPEHLLTQPRAMFKSTSDVLKKASSP